MHSFFTRSVAGRVAAASLAFLAALLVAACGGHDYSAAPAGPAIAAFAATPATVPVGGGQVTLSWSASNATQLSIDQGVGDVSGSTSKTVAVTAGTTFTLTATNSVGNVTAATVVTVAAQPAPVISAFAATPTTLPAGGGSVALSWTTTGATTLTIDNGVGDVSGLTNKAVNVAANTTFTLTATNASGSVTQTTGVAVGSADTQYLDVVNGADANPCTQAAPCKTLTTAVGRHGPGGTFVLSDGVYGKTSEGRPGLTLPADTTIRALHAGAVTLASLQIVVPDGSVTLDGVVIGPESASSDYCGSFGVGQNNATTPLQTVALNGVFSNCFNWLVLTGNTKATMTPGSLAGGLYTTGLSNVGSVPNGYQWLSVGSGAQLTITGGVIEGNHTGSPRNEAGVLHLPNDATLTLDGVTVRNWSEPAIFQQSSVVVLRNGTSFDTVGDPANPTSCAFSVSGPSSLTMDHSTLSNVPGDGICVGSTSTNTALTPVLLTQTTISGVVGAAVSSRFNGGVAANLTADGLRLTNNGWGIYWVGGDNSVVSLRNSTISGSSNVTSGGAIYFEPQNVNHGATLKLRASSITGNLSDGIFLGQIATSSIDLGTTADPGGNTLSGNATTSLHIGAFAGSALVNAVGNTWAAGQQGADANGRYSVPPGYAPVPKTGTSSGANYASESSAATLNL